MASNEDIPGLAHLEEVIELNKKFKQQTIVVQTCYEGKWNNFPMPKYLIVIYF